MSDTFKGPEWQAHMQAELAWTRNPNQTTAGAVIRTFHAWARKHLTDDQRKARVPDILKRLQAKLPAPLQERETAA